MAHLISVDDIDIFRRFIRDGFIGVRFPESYYAKIQGKTVSRQRVSYFLRTVYDIFADLKRVKPGDEIFVHVKDEQAIHGTFVACSYFLEDPTIPSSIQSSNLVVDQAASHTLPTLPMDAFPWQVSIKAKEGQCFSRGFDANQVFRIKELTHKIWTVPERWKYEDKPKTVRPLLPEEGRELLALLQESNSGRQGSMTTFTKDVTQFRRIVLPMDLVSDEVRNEKLIEAWLMENTISPEDEGSHTNISDLLGDFTFIANTIRSYYVKFMDVFGYVESNGSDRSFKIIETKRGDVTTNDVKQTVGYVNWIIESQANHDAAKVRAFIIGRHFPQDASTAVNNQVGRGLNLSPLTYQVSNGSFRIRLPN